MVLSAWPEGCGSACNLDPTVSRRLISLSRRSAIMRREEQPHRTLMTNPAEIMWTLSRSSKSSGARRVTKCIARTGDPPVDKESPVVDQIATAYVMAVPIPH